MCRSIMGPGRSAWIVAAAPCGASAARARDAPRTTTIAAAQTRIASFLLEYDRRPAVRRPADRRDAQRRHPAVLRVIGVIDEIGAVAVAAYRLSAGALVAIVADEHLLAVAVHHLLAVGAEIRPQHVLRTPGDDVVVALRAAAAEVERDEEVIVPAMLGEERRLDRVGRLRPPGERLNLRAGRGLARRGIERHDLDPRPEAPEGEPVLAVLVDEAVGIDAVGFVERVRRDHQPLVLPSEAGRNGIE